jgi:hypothetical protein
MPVARFQILPGDSNDETFLGQRDSCWGWCQGVHIALQKTLASATGNFGGFGVPE